MKREMLKHARHSFVLCGIYCGGRSFDNFLDIAKKKFESNPDFTGHIITQSIHLDKTNLKKLQELKNNFPDRFHYVITPAYRPYKNVYTNEITCSEIHGKLMIADELYGLGGGSGIVDVWDNPSDQAEETPSLDFKFWDFFKKISHSFYPSSFRDQDFLFKSAQMKTMNHELLKLFALASYNYGDKKVHFPQPRKIPSEPIPEIERYFDHEDVNVKMFVSGPEHKKRYLEKEIISYIEREQESITIAHLYFRLTPEVFEALKRAAERGVKIKILTNRVAGNSPRLHVTFAFENVKRALQLASCSKNVEVYYWNVPNITYHKKVIVFGEHSMIVGSGNLGVLSLQNHAYETNFTINSDASVKQELAYLNEDFEKHATREPVKNLLKEAIQSLLSERA